jgi:hypothetical protein
VKRALPVSDPPAGWPVRAAAGELLEAWGGGGPPWEAALEGAACLCRLLPARDSADEERRELLEGIVEELRASPVKRERSPWAGLLAHLAATPAPPVAVY